MPSLFVWLALISLACFTLPVESYKPIFFMHGFDGSGADWNDIMAIIPHYHKNTPMYDLRILAKLQSMEPLWMQLPKVLATIEDTIAKNPSVFANGYHFMGHSQGGLIMRSVVELMDNHKVSFYWRLLYFFIVWTCFYLCCVVSNLLPACDSQPINQRVSAIVRVILLWLRLLLLCCFTHVSLSLCSWVFVCLAGVAFFCLRVFAVIGAYFCVSGRCTSWLLRPASVGR